MKLRISRWVLATGSMLLLAGCEGTTTKVQVRPPAAVPSPSPVNVSEPLPLPGRSLSTASLRSDPRPAIDILVGQVQASFSASQQDFKIGHPDEGRAALDRAVNLILASGFQAESDPRLSRLFDQIGEAMHAYPATPGQSAEEEAEEAESAPPAQPAPIDEIADLTLPEGDTRLIFKAQRELITVSHDLPLAVNDSVLQYLSFFTTPRGRAIMQHGLGRAGRYNDLIRRVLKEEGVPQDLIYLAQAESAFQPQAVSRSGARGIWQFMPFRGEQYDLERSYWIDERSDPEKATRAAARHLRDLYGMFGDWYLAMAAYNSGPGNVAKAIERTGYADFWELQKRNALPKETQNYVPIIVAMALVAKAPQLYGVQIEPEKPAVVEAVKLDHPVDLHLVADATGADLDGLRLLNPQLLRTVTPSQPGFELKLPVGLTARFEQNIQQVPEDKRTAWRLHTVSDGETLSDIARRYRLTVPALEVANHLDAHASVPSGFLLNVPTVPPVTRLVHYRVQKGDTLEGIADRFDVTVTELKRWNHIAGNHVPRGVRLKVYAGSESASISAAAPSRTASRSSRPVERTVSARSAEKFDAVQHKVQPGETLYSIAHEYRTTVSALKQSNRFLADRSLETGDLLTIQR